MESLVNFGLDKAWASGFVNQCPDTSTVSAPANWAYCWTPNNHYFQAGGQVGGNHVVRFAGNPFIVQVYPSLTYTTIAAGGGPAWTRTWVECGTSVIGAVGGFPDLIGTFDAAATCMSTLLHSL
jgi:hypothetical protein